MDSKNPQTATIEECFSEQITAFALKEAIQLVRNEPNGIFEYLSLSIQIPAVDPLAVLEQNEKADTFHYYWEKPSENFSMAAAGVINRIKTTGEQRFRHASDQGKSLLNKVYHISEIKHSLASVHLLGGFSFFDHNIGKEWREFGAGSFTLPEWLLVRKGDLTVLTITKKVDQYKDVSENVNAFSSCIKKLEKICDAGTYKTNADTSFNSRIKVPEKASDEYKKWVDSVENATDLIKADQFKKIVLARQLKIELHQPASATRILNQLRNQYPDCYTFMVSQDGETAFLGSTPERLASFHDRDIETEGLAGSISRGKTASEDAALEYRLRHSQKDLNEHAFVLDAIEENLQQYSDVFEHPVSPDVKKLSNVQHLYTPVHATIKDGVSRTEVLSKLHPTPAVGGYPRDAAMPFINKLEHFDRGWYAAPVGWINAHGNGEFVVAIRSGLLKNNEVRFYAGCGIVENSDPHREWEETNLKFIPMLTALEYARK